MECAQLTGNVALLQPLLIEEKSHKAITLIRMTIEKSINQSMTVLGQENEVEGVSITVEEVLHRMRGVKGLCLLADIEMC
jgi:hypothetical protein